MPQELKCATCRDMEARIGCGVKTAVKADGHRCLLRRRGVGIYVQKGTVPSWCPKLR
jgi:hypothetical protein